MSMQDYGFQENGFVIDSKVCAYLTGYFVRTDPDFPDEDIRKTALRPDFFDLVEKGNLDEEFYDMDYIQERLEADDVNVVHCGSFCGEASTIAEMLSGKKWDPLEIEYDDDFLLMIPLARAPELFKQAYRNAEEVIQEIKDVLSPYKDAFPDDFDIPRYICEVSGTYFC